MRSLYRVCIGVYLQGSGNRCETKEDPMGKILDNEMETAGL